MKHDLENVKGYFRRIKANLYFGKYDQELRVLTIFMALYLVVSGLYNLL